MCAYVCVEGKGRLELLTDRMFAGDVVGGDTHTCTQTGVADQP